MFPQVVNEFVEMCGKCGMDTRDAKWAYRVISPPSRERDPSREQAIGMVRENIRGLPGRPSLALLLLSSDDKILYVGLKYVPRPELHCADAHELRHRALLDVTLGVVNVCVLSQKFRKGQVCTDSIIGFRRLAEVLTYNDGIASIFRQCSPESQYETRRGEPCSDWSRQHLASAKANHAYGCGRDAS